MKFLERLYNRSPADRGAAPRLAGGPNPWQRWLVLATLLDASSAAAAPAASPGPSTAPGAPAAQASAPPRAAAPRVDARASTAAQTSSPSAPPGNAGATASSSPSAPSAPPSASTSPAAGAPAPASGAAPSSAPAPSASPLNPAPAELPAQRPAPSGVDLDGWISRVAELRSRIDALTSALYSSRLRVELRADGDGVRVHALRVSLDGGVVYVAPAQASFEQPNVVYEHAVAPGTHVLGVEIERRDARDPRFSSFQEARFVVVVPEKKSLLTHLALADGSTMGEDFSEDEAGTYELGVRLEVEVSD